jgi:hypothetical protein
MEYGRKVDALRTRYKEYLWDAEFRDTLGAKVMVDGKAYPNYSVFGGDGEIRIAVVIANQSEHKAIEATVQWTGGKTGPLMVTPENPEPQRSDGKVSIPPRSVVVLLGDEVARY